MLDQCKLGTKTLRTDSRKVGLRSRQTTSFKRCLGGVCVSQIHRRGRNMVGYDQ